MRKTVKKYQNAVAAEVGYYEEVQEKKERFSRRSALVLGLIGALEVMIAGAMVLNIDVLQADSIALILAFVVLYFGIVSMLTND